MTGVTEMGRRKRYKEATKTEHTGLSFPPSHRVATSHRGPGPFLGYRLCLVAGEDRVGDFLRRHDRRNIGVGARNARHH